MATHVASNAANPTKGGDNHSAAQELSGTSYAHAVLNLKSNDNSNKENISEGVKDVQLRTNKSATLQTSKPAALQMNTKILKEPVESHFDDGDSFTPVVNHSRKERKTEKNKREKLKEAKPLHNGVVEKRETSTATKEAVKETSSQVSEDSQESKKVFVEAPLPKVNPWQTNKNAAQVLAAKEVQPEKRILQPQKQHTTVNGQPSPSVVRAPKDRRKNQRVSFIYFLTSVVKR